jgi:hypothetical protein
MAIPDSMDGKHHEIAAGDQQHGVDEATGPVQLQLRRIEQFDIVRTGKRVRQKKNAEYQQFGKDKAPHRKIARKIAAVAMWCWKRH